MSRREKGGWLIGIGVIMMLTLPATILLLKAMGEEARKSLTATIITAVTMLIFGVGIFFVIGGIAKINEGRAPAPRTSPRPKPQVVKAKLVSVDGVTATSRSGTVSGALVGGILAGGVGAILGGMANTKDHTYNVDTKYTFLVLYDNGTQQLETLSARGDKKRLELLVSKIDINEN